MSSKVLAFDVDDETVTYIDPPPDGWPMSSLMEVWGRPCVATGCGETTMLWTLTPDHHRRWELRCSFATIIPSPRSKATGGDGAMVHDAWDCGGGLLIVFFRDDRGCKYEYGPAAVALEVNSVAADNLLPAELQKANFCWEYKPTLIPPATVVAGADAACPGGECDGSTHFSSGTNAYGGDDEEAANGLIVSLTPSRQSWLQGPATPAPSDERLQSPASGHRRVIRIKEGRPEEKPRNARRVRSDDRQQYGIASYSTWTHHVWTAL
ncbi:hypothetical protein HU200_029260 [Digitaria exilis]|uniref:Uncharacterized protein n=1 Tax=Digitaria exilis TaxID=1010633 RepID=A0A835C230_9POAL|nr:hypothetical protein HU200_029260 [Digitaria exilis]